MKILPVAIMTTVWMAWLPQDPGRGTYLNHEPVVFEIVQASGKEKVASVGPWKLGAKIVESKPHDTRLNLYIVIPGDDFQAESESASGYDHNRVINMVPKEGGPEDFDVYWAIALEPHLNEDFHGEGEMLAEAQKRFVPGDLYELKDAPGAAFLREVLRIDSLAELKPYRRKDGSLPHLLIVPAGFAVRATVQR